MNHNNMHTILNKIEEYVLYGNTIKKTIYTLLFIFIFWYNFDIHDKCLSFKITKPTFV